jgi:hypothetical protein
MSSALLKTFSTFSWPITVVIATKKTTAEIIPIKRTKQSNEISSGIKNPVKTVLYKPINIPPPKKPGRTGKTIRTNGQRPFFCRIQTGIGILKILEQGKNRQRKDLFQQKNR